MAVSGLDERTVSATAKRYSVVLRSGVLHTDYAHVEAAYTCTYMYEHVRRAGCWAVALENS